MATTSRNINNLYVHPNKRKWINNHQIKNKETIKSMEKEKEQFLIELSQISNGMIITKSQNTINSQLILVQFDDYLNSLEKKHSDLNKLKSDIEHYIETNSKKMFDNNQSIQQIDCYLQQSTNYITNCINSNPRFISIEQQKYIYNLKHSVNKAVHNKEQFIDNYTQQSTIVEEGKRRLSTIALSIDTCEKDISINTINRNISIQFYKNLHHQNTLAGKKKLKKTQAKIDWIDSLIRILQL
jgi:hypothetical protein